MARINKLKRDKAIAALKKAGASPAVAQSIWRMLDLGENLDPQIASLVEEDPELFGTAEEDEPAEEDTPMSPAEARNARLRGSRVRDMQFRRPKTERPSTAPATAQEAAAHLRKNTGRNKPPVQKYREELPDRNAHAFPARREPSSSAKQIAARLQGN